MAVWAFLDIAAWNVKLPLADAAIITWRCGGSPTEAFVSVFDSRERLSADIVLR